MNLPNSMLESLTTYVFKVNFKNVFNISGESNFSLITSSKSGPVVKIN